MSSQVKLSKIVNIYRYSGIWFLVKVVETFKSTRRKVSKGGKGRWEFVIERRKIVGSNQNGEELEVHSPYCNTGFGVQRHRLERINCITKTLCTVTTYIVIK